jgi:hypothetical protein
MLFKIVNNVSKSSLIDYFYETDEKIDFLIKKVEPLFDHTNEYYGNLEPLNRRSILKEIKVFRGKKSYTINKKRVFLCLKDENNKYYNDNMLVYVFLHELSHVICDEIGHTNKFNEIFKELLDVAVEKKIWDPNQDIILNYCDY